MKLQSSGRIGIAERASAGTTLGMKIRPVPTIHSQATDALCNAALSSMLIIKGRYDIVHFHGHSSYCVIPLVKKFGKTAVITVHQIESAWDNPKYNSFGQRIIKSMFVKGVKEADRITTVAKYLQDQIKKYSTRTPSLCRAESIPPRQRVRKL